MTSLLCYFAKQSFTQKRTGFASETACCENAAGRLIFLRFIFTEQRDGTHQHNDTQSEADRTQERVQPIGKIADHSTAQSAEAYINNFLHCQ